VAENLVESPDKATEMEVPSRRRFLILSHCSFRNQHHSGEAKQPDDDRDFLANASQVGKCQC